jgi:pimeloyl-ACP methyl ester carboxylesterase
MPDSSQLAIIVDMSLNWDIVRSGPADAERTVLLLPGGMCSARSWVDVMAEPVLASTRMVAVTLPGNAGAEPLADYSIEAQAAAIAELAKRERVDVVVGFSAGATAAVEMVVSGLFAGPVVLLGVSLSAADEPAFFRGIVHLCSVFGTLPMRALKKGVDAMVKHAPVPAERLAELRVDFARNRPSDMRANLRAYLRWLHRDDDPAQRLCRSGVPAWVVHGEKGDGGLTAHERSILEACPEVRVITLPGHVFFIPNEVPGRVADVVVAALGAVRR